MKKPMNIFFMSWSENERGNRAEVKQFSSLETPARLPFVLAALPSASHFRPGHGSSKCPTDLAPRGLSSKTSVLTGYALSWNAERTIGE